MIMKSLIAKIFGKRENSQSVSSKSRSHTKARHLLFEPLEERQLLAIVTWDGGGDGRSWGDAANWSGNALPTKDDDVIIDLATLDPVIEIRTGNDIAIKSLTSNERITMTGGTLEVSEVAYFTQNFTLSGGTLKNGIWDKLENTQFVVSGSTAIFDGVTVGDVTISHNTTLTVVNGLTLAGALNIGDGIYTSVVTFVGTQTLGGTGTVNLNSNLNGRRIRVEGTEETPAVLTVGENVRITGTTAYSKSIESMNGRIVNYGTIESEEGTLTLSAEVENHGTIQSSGGTMNVQSTVDNMQGEILCHAGTLNFSGNANVIGGVIDRIDGTVNVGGNTAIFDGVTVGDVTVGGTLTVVNGLTLSGTLAVNYNSIIQFVGTQTLGGTGTVNLINNYTVSYPAYLRVQGTEESFAVLTVGENAQITGTGSQTTFITSTNGRIVNYGTIEAQQGSLTLSAETENRGMIQANGGTMNIQSTVDNIHGEFLCHAGMLNFSGNANVIGGVIDRIDGTVNVGGSTAIFDGVTVGDVTVGGTLTVLNGLTLSGTLGISGGGTVKFVGTQTLDGTGTVDLIYRDYSYVSNYFRVEGTEEMSAVLTVGENVLVTSSYGDNRNFIESTNGKIVNHGTIASGLGSLALSVETENHGTIQANGGTLTINTTINNVNNNTIRALSGSVTFTNTTVIVGGTITDLGANIATTTFNGVTVGDVTVGGTLTVLNGLTLSGTLGIRGGGTVKFVGTQTLDGTGTVDLIYHDYSYVSEYFRVEGTEETPAVLTVGKNVRITSSYGDNRNFIESTNGKIVNYGTIESGLGSLTLSAEVENHGTISRTSGSLVFSGILVNEGKTFYYDAVTSLWTFSNATIRGGIVAARDGLRFMEKGGSIRLDGVRLDEDMTIASNVTIINGLDFAGTLTVSGTVTMQGPDVALDGTGTIILNNGTINVTGGTVENPAMFTLGPKITLTGAGHISNVNVTVINQGTIAPEGTITIAGSFVQGRTGAINIRIWGNTTYDILTIGGRASFDGRINILRHNYYTPSATNISFRPIRYASFDAAEYLYIDGLDFGGYSSLAVQWNNTELIFTVGWQSGPKVIALIPCSNTSRGITRPYFDVIFDQAIDPATVVAAQFDVRNEAGQRIGIRSIQKLNSKGDSWRIFLAIDDEFNGKYDVKVGPQIKNLLGLPMNQNGNDINGEEDDIYEGFVVISLPDLEVSLSDEFPPAVAELGTVFDVSWIVTNVGYADALGSWVDRIYLSKKPTFDSSAYLLASVNCGTGSTFGVALEVGEYYENTKRIMIPMDTVTWTPGTYYIIIFTDVNNSILEYTERNNNIVSRAIELVHPQLSDLTVTDVRCLSNPVPGGVVDIAWVTTNLGERPTSGSWQETIYLSKDGTMKGAIALQTVTCSPEYPLQPDWPSINRRATVRIPATWVEGEYYIIVQTDTSNKIVELDKSNNIGVSEKTIMVPKLLSMTFNSATTNSEKTTARVNEGQTIAATISRSGDLSQPLTVTLTNNNTEYFRIPQSVTIPAGQASVTFNVVALHDGIVSGEHWADFTATAADSQFNVATTRISSMDIDMPTLTLAMTRDGTALDHVNAGDSFELTITRDYGFDKSLYVNLRQSTAKQLNLPGTVLIPAGESSVTITVKAIDDKSPKPDEWVKISAISTGFSSGITEIFVGSHYRPELALTFVTDTVVKGAGGNALMGTISRNETTNDNLLVRLTSSRPDKILVPAEVIIPAGKASVDFYMASLGDGIVDGTIDVTITAVGVIPSCDCSTPDINAGMTTGIIHVLDDNVAALQMRLEKIILEEGQSVATYLTVSRNTADTSQPLTITLSATVAGILTFPTTVTIPAGSVSTRIPIGTTSGNITSDDIWVTIIGTAEGFVKSSATALITNTAAADLIVSQITVPLEGFATKQTQISYTVRNQGNLIAAGSWQEKVWISSTPNLTGSSILIGAFERSGNLSATPGSNEVSHTVSLTLPDRVGQYWIIVTVDTNNQVKESIKTNNTSVSKSAINTYAPYVAIVHTDSNKVDPNTPVRLYGQANDIVTLQPVANAAVDVYIVSQGGVRTIRVQTGADGTFEYYWTPLKDEMGTYQLGAVYPGATGQLPIQATFSIMKMVVAPTRGTFHVGEKESVTGTFTIHNVANIPMTGIKCEVIGMPDNVQMEIHCNNVIPPNGSTQVSVTVTALNASIPVSTVTLRLWSNETNYVDVPVFLNIYPGQANLTTFTKKIDEFLIQGQQRIIEFEITNESNINSGPITLALPNVPWLSALNGTTLPSLAPGETGTVRLLLTPAANMALTEFTGQIALNYTNTGMTIPFRFKVFSPEQAKGDLSLKAVDEYYYFTDDKAGLSNAQVTITDSRTRSLVSYGTTDSEGNLLVRELPAGYYDVRISTDKHDSYYATLEVRPGETTAQTAFMPYQAVTYEWTVTPATIEDKYEITVAAKYETNVPVPAVVMEPASIDLSDLLSVGQKKQIDITFTNHGLIAANDVGIYFEDHPEIRIIKLVDKIDKLPAKSSMTITIIAERIAPGEEPAPAPFAAQSEVNFNGIPMNQAAFYDEGAMMSPATAAAINATAAQVVAAANDTKICHIKGSTVYGYYCNGTQWVWGVVHVNPPRDYVCAPIKYSGGGGGGGIITGGIGGGNTYTAPSSFGSYSSGNKSASINERTTPVTVSQDEDCEPCYKAIFNALANCIPFFREGTCFRDFVWTEVGAINSGHNAWDYVWTAAGCIFQKGWASNALKLKGAFDCGWAIGSAITACLGGLGEFFFSSNSVSAASLAMPLASYLPSVRNHFSRTGISELDHIIDQFVIRFDQLLESYYWVEYITGISVWQNSDIGNKFFDFMESFWILAEKGTLLESDITVLLEMPTPENMIPSDVLRLIDRWNRTVDYYERGIFTLSDIPEGESTDFIDYEYLYALVSHAIDLDDAVILEGYSNVLDAYMTVRQQLSDTVEARIAGGVCAKVSLQLKQTAVLTRDAFDAQLVLNSSVNPLTDVGVDIIITDAYGNDVTRFFGIYPPVTTGFFATSGTPESCVGNLAAQTTGKANWIFIPSTELAKYGPEVYYVGGFLRYTENGQAISIPLTAVGITVYPQPELDLVYFWQRDVYGDDPWTEEIEPSVPFELVVMVVNNGGGTAQQMRIESGQPTIVDNEKGLLVDFAIVGSRVNGKDYSPSLTVNFGDIDPGGIAIGQWYMISTLQGQFTDFQASFRHINGFNDLQFSLIKSIEIHELIRTVNANGDGLPDMLVNDHNTLYGGVPDTLYMSDGSIHDVGYCSDGTISGKTDSAMGFSMIVSAAMPSGWGYLRLSDTEIDSSMYRLYRVERSDGTEVPLENFWQTDRTFITGSQRAVYEQNLHLLDYDSTGQYVFYFESIIDIPLSVEYVEQVPNRLTETPVSGFDIQFNREIDLDSFTWQDLTLTRGQSGNLLNKNVTIEHVEGTLYRINGLAEFTRADGEYVLTVHTSGIHDVFGTPGTGVAFARWIKATNSPIIVAIDNTPAPFGQSSLDSLDIHFSLPIADGSLDRSALTLTCDGGENLINESVTIMRVSDTHWRISGLAALTSQDGYYELTINVTGVTGTDMVKGIGQETIAWVKDTVGPDKAEWSGVTRDSTNYAYNSLYLEFSERIDASSFDYRNLVLTRNGVNIPLDNRVIVRLVTSNDQGTQWIITGLEPFTQPDGQYTISINLAGVKDLSGNAGLGTASISWEMDTAPINFTSTLARTTMLYGPLALRESVPVYNVADNLVFYSNSESNRLQGSFSKPNLTVQIYDKSTGYQLAAVTLIDTTEFNLVVDFMREGIHDFVIRVSDRAGNWEEFERTIYVDMTAPFVIDVRTPTSSSNHSMDVIEVAFSKSTNIVELINNGTISGAVRLVLGSETISIPQDRFTYNARTMTLSVSLEGLLSEIPNGGANLELKIDGSAIYDKAGNELRGSRADSTQHSIPVFAEAIEIMAASSPIIVDSYSVPVFADWNGDGIPNLIVGEMSNDGFGRIRVYLNSGTAEEPVFTTFFYAMCGDTELKIDASGCQGAAPRLVDWNGNGLMDLVVGRSDGQIQVFLNIGSKDNPIFAPPTFVQVGTGENARNLNVGARAVFDIVDWNNDGRFDLVVGGLDGKIHVFLNSSDSGAPVFETESIIQLNDNDLVVSSGRAAVSVVDLNGDGKKDLVIGNTDGSIWYYQNVGTDAAPRFTTGQRLQASDTDIKLDGSARTRPFVVDYNNDGVLDLLVGSQDGKIRLYLGRNAMSFTSDGNPGDEFVSTFYLTPTSTTTPEVEFVSLTPATQQHPYDPVHSVTLVFSDSVTYDEAITAISVTKDNVIVSGMTFDVSGSGTTYVIRWNNQLDGIGIYVLTVNGSAFTDVNGLAVSGTIHTEWTVAEQQFSSIIVTTLDDVVDPLDGLISLREAIAYANAGDTITFAPELYGKTITLNGNELYIDKNITIDASDMNITINADQKSRVFSIVGCDVTLVVLTITGGNATNGGGIYVKNAVLSLMDSEVIGNKSTTVAAIVRPHCVPR